MSRADKEAVDQIPIPQTAGGGDVSESRLQVIAQVVSLPLLKIHNHLEMINPVGIDPGTVLIHGPGR